MGESILRRASSAAARRTGRFFQYCVANFWTLLPFGAAFIVVAIAANVTATPDSCRDATSKTANWLLCNSKSDPLDALLGKSKLKVLGTPGALPTIVESDLKKGLAPDDKTKPPATGAGAADKDKKYADIAVDIDTAAREAKARVIWATSYGTLIMIALVSSVAAFLFIVQAVVGHRRAMGIPTSVQAAGGPQRPQLPPGEATAYIFQFIGIAAIVLVIALGVVKVLVNVIFKSAGASVGSFSSFNPLHGTIFNDQVMSWLGTATDHRIDGYLSVAEILLFASLILVAVLVSSSLYQAPDDDAFRKSMDISEPKNASYVRYLGLSFGRLKIAVYLGAALLVGSVAEISAQFHWALSMLPDSSASASVKAASTSLLSFTDQLTTEIGFGFTLVLAALYFPAISILRTRGRDYYRWRNPEKTLSEQENFLTAQGLTLNFSSAYTDFIALLAPLAASVAPQLFKLLSAN